MAARSELLTQPNALDAGRQGAIEVHRNTFTQDYSSAFLPRFVLITTGRNVMERGCWEGVNHRRSPLHVIIAMRDQMPDGAGKNIVPVATASRARRV